jgi:hypothetical protein
VTSETDIREWVRAAVSGDARVVERLAALGHERLMAAQFHAGDLTITREAVLRALFDYQSGRIVDTELERWAWFVSRGYIPGTAHGPVSPLKIDYEPDFEELILAAIGRFSELGDAVDGKIEPAELDALARHLTP